MNNLSSFEKQFLGLTEEEFTKLYAYSTVQRSIAYVLIITELFIHFLALPLSIINIKIISKTMVVHQNLKFILCCQCGVILFVSTIHLLFVGPVKFISGDLFWSENEFRNQFFVEFLFSCPLFFQMLCGHLIILERLFATVCASRYEKCSGFVFSISWILILALITIFNIYVKNVEEIVNPEDIGVKGSAFGCTLFSLIASFSLALISLAEFLCFAYLWHYNKSEYSNQSGQTVLNANYQLTKQYQHLENIRTTRQLGPTLFIYFLIQLLTACEQAFVYFFYIADEYPQEIISQSNQLIMTLLSLIIELSIIIFHPILHQNFIDLLDRILPIKFVGTNRVAPALELAVAGSLEPRASQQMDKHFVLLKNSWEK